MRAMMVHKVSMLRRRCEALSGHNVRQLRKSQARSDVAKFGEGHAREADPAPTVDALRA